MAKESKYPKVSIIIVNWNGGEDILECLKSVKDIDYPDYETIVVDNGSTDNSVAEIKRAFPDIKLILNDKNLGYPAGVGRRIKAKSPVAFKQLVVLAIFTFSVFLGYTAKLLRRKEKSGP